MQPDPLDPSYLLDIENDARHLATSVDSLVENLASILHNISALTVDAIEVYRLEFPFTLSLLSPWWFWWSVTQTLSEPILMSHLALKILEKFALVTFSI